MHNLATITNNNQLTMSSLEIAELTGKEHKHVVRDIREMLAQLGQSKFGLAEFEGVYQDKQGKPRPCYYLPKEETLCLIAGYSTLLRMKIIKRWQELEHNSNIKLPNNYVEALEQLTAEVKAKAELENKLEEAKPKLIFASAVENSNDLIKIGDLAKILKQNGIDIGQNRLFNYLRAYGYLQRDNRPTQKAMELGLFKIIERTINESNNNPKLIFTTKVTGRGQAYFVNKFLNNFNM